MENECLLAEVARLKKLLGASEAAGAVGGEDELQLQLHLQQLETTDDTRLEKLENELRIAKELIQSKSRRLAKSSFKFSF